VDNAGCDGVSALTEKARVPISLTRIKQHSRDISEILGTTKC
jgi:hypothetical protein